MKKFFRLLLRYGTSIPKSLYFCFRMFPFHIAIRLPILVSRHVWLEDLHGKIEIPKEFKIGGIRIGFEKVGTFDYSHSRTILQLGGGMISFKGTCSFGQGMRISFGRNGHLIIGNNVNFTAESSIICYNCIEFDDDALISWDCQFMDTDFHSLIQDNEVVNYNEPIKIGKHCWICSRCLILKGSHLKDNCVLGGGGSTLSLVQHEPNSLLVGVPARVIRII